MTQPSKAAIVKKITAEFNALLTGVAETPDAPPAIAGLESLAAELHWVYQREAKRQGDVRHADDYKELPESVKQFDRVLAKFMLERESAIRREAERAAFEKAAQHYPHSERSRRTGAWQYECTCGWEGPDWRDHVRALAGGSQVSGATSAAKDGDAK